RRLPSTSARRLKAGRGGGNTEIDGEEGRYPHASGAARARRGFPAERSPPGFIGSAAQDTGGRTRTGTRPAVLPAEHGRGREGRQGVAAPLPTGLRGGTAPRPGAGRRPRPPGPVRPGRPRLAARCRRLRGGDGRATAGGGPAPEPFGRLTAPTS